MKRLMILTLMLFLLLLTKPLLADVIFYDDAENAPNTSNDWLVRDYGNSISVSSEKARVGKSSYKFMSGPYPQYESHCELILRGLNSKPEIKNFIYNKEYWMGWSVYISV